MKTNIKNVAGNRVGDARHHTTNLHTNISTYILAPTFFPRGEQITQIVQSKERALLFMASWSQTEQSARRQEHRRTTSVGLVPPESPQNLREPQVGSGSGLHMTDETRPHSVKLWKEGIQEKYLKLQV